MVAGGCFSGGWFLCFVWVCCLVLFLVRIVSFPSLHTKAVELFQVLVLGRTLLRVLVFGTLF